MEHTIEYSPSQNFWHIAPADERHLSPGDWALVRTFPTYVEANAWLDTPEAREEQRKRWADVPHDPTRCGDWWLGDCMKPSMPNCPSCLEHAFLWWAP